MSSEYPTSIPYHNNESVSLEKKYGSTVLHIISKKYNIDVSLLEIKSTSLSEKYRDRIYFIINNKKTGDWIGVSAEQSEESILKDIRMDQI